MGVVYLKGPLLGLDYTQSTLSGSSASFRYLIASDDKNDGPLTLSQDRRLPRMFTEYRVGNDANSNLILQSIKWKHLGAKPNKGFKTIYEATFNYAPRNFSTNDPGEDLEHPNSPSENDSFSFSSSWEVMKVPAVTDIYGERICNSAGDDFTRPVEVDRRIRINRLTRRENIDPQIKANAFTGTVNGYPIWGGAEGTWLMEILVSGVGGEAGWTVDYNMRYDPDGWQVQVLDQGLGKIDPLWEAKGITIPIEDGEGSAITTPRLLDGQGKELTAHASPVYLDFEVIGQSDFYQLYLPDWLR